MRPWLTIRRRRDGVRATFRNAQFLDERRRAARFWRNSIAPKLIARRNGWAVTIGHPHAGYDRRACAKQLPRLNRTASSLVFVSEVVK